MVDFPPQPVITKDNVTMQIDTVVYFQITDPKLYAYGVELSLIHISLSLIKRLDDIDLYELGAAVKQIAEYKLKVQDYFDLIMVWYRDVLYMKATLKYRWGPIR